MFNYVHSILPTKKPYSIINIIFNYKTSQHRKSWKKLIGNQINKQKIQTVKK